jgi:asparagine N-glycosylation enzyme membrane subunit Stt3
MKVPLNTYGDAYDQTIAAKLYLQDGKGLSRYRLVYESPHQSLMSYEVRGDSSASSPAFFRISLGLDTEEQREFAARAALSPYVPREFGDVLRYGFQTTSTVKIFEVVPGATLAGHAWPGAKITVFLGLRVLSTAREFVYQVGTTADQSGRFAITVPYSTSGSSRAVVGNAPMQLHILAPETGTELVFRVDVQEDKVLRGQTVYIGNVRDVAASHVP